ncbi:choice-of-anchor M domain-containing protein [Actinoplanes sp. NPDC000266]
MRRSLRLLVGGGALATALLGTAVPAQAFATPVVISAGHVDVVDVAYEDGALELGLHDESVEPDVERDPDDVVLFVKRAARTTVPDNPSFSFLGGAGSKVWVLPEIQDEELLWPGLSAEEIEAGVFTGDAVTAKVERVTGPGRLAIWTEDAVGTPHVLVNSGDGLPDSVALAAGAHQHASWAFQKAGVYLIKVRATATLAATGATITSDPAVYKVVVQP